MNAIIGIYKITSPNGKVYIGQSKNIDKRWYSYSKIIKTKGQSKLYSSFLEHGVNNHSFEILAICDLHELNVLERYFQDVYDCIGEKGLNASLTGTPKKRHVFSQYYRQKMSEGYTNMPIEKKKNVNKGHAKNVLDKTTGCIYYGLTLASSATGVKAWKICDDAKSKNIRFTYI